MYFLCWQMLFKKEYRRTEGTEAEEILINIFLRNPLMVGLAFFPISFYNLSPYLFIFLSNFLSICLPICRV